MLKIVDWAWSNASTLRDLAAVIAVAATFIGFAVTMWRTSVQRQVQREISAKQTWSRVLRLCFDHPAFAEPKKGMSLHKDTERGTQYIWFVSNILNSLDEILLASNDDIWLRTAREVMAYHRVWLSDADFRSSEFLTYSSGLRSLIDEVAKSPTTT